MPSKSRGQRGSLTQQDDGRWLARYWTNGRGSKRPQRIFPANEKRKAAAWLRDRIAEVDAARYGETSALIREREAGLTVDVMCERYLAAHEAHPVTLRKIRAHLVIARREFGSRLVTSLEPYELATWRKTIAAGYRAQVFSSFQQVCRQSVRWGWIPADPCAMVKNPRQRRNEVPIPAWEAVTRIADEIDRRYTALPIVAAGCGLRIEELLGLERADVDLDTRVLRIRRVWSSGILTELGQDGAKTWRQRRDVPIRHVVRDALRDAVRRIDTPILFPAPKGGRLNGEKFRSRIWTPALYAAGVDYFPPKDLRHLYASESLAAGVGLFTLSRRMGTSLKEIDATYGHLVPDALEMELGLLDAYDLRQRRIQGQA